MDIKDFENLILNEVNLAVLNIIRDFTELDISARSRAGAEISKFLEEKFVEYTKSHKFLKNSVPSPRGATKNPWDVKTVFHYKNIKEKIWIDFKAIKISGKGSNPDIGTPNKVIDFIKSGHFYLLYVYVFYEETERGLKFVEVNSNNTKSYFLKDIHHSFRRNPKNQLQVNIRELPEYRTREEFIKLLIKKIKESHQRQIQISQKALQEIPDEENLLLDKNKESEFKILENLK